mmetsp:Transcript_9032/g.22614  ORF Transcript_9032/g.22614 Transcript_9032/m.22614 type:complete len:132 (+) Transcript_9032:48-443(+)|eukprot:CAMPEP_0206253502 /NCGR_PEP_ID=MMETSP0047_2-20121206/23185_1 /ASSEMBLY_ACC=CAM_ASM_000192 /TAXON_ID=195065 /ORGANISM="Chroomonas mesostigmatica_cf, Strain CCMP1168" /LENGTH=131 /DNA_ID=CAMNT_0053679713 /DNA_START=24 /DNA_END=419 /DNA_ORIENTATION=-
MSPSSYTLAAAACLIGMEAVSAFTTGGFVPLGTSQLRPSLRRAPAAGIRMGGLEQVEFIIHKDGRVEEKVTGVKGKQCHEITKEVEELLGKVTYTQPTSELFEEEVQVTTQETQQVQDGSQNQESWGQSKW